MVSLKFLEKPNLAGFLEALSRERAVYVPAAIDGVVNFTRWRQGVPVTLSYINTVLPPKDLLFPRTEAIFEFATRGNEITITPLSPHKEERVVFGIRPCDMRSLTLMDRVFLRDGAGDGTGGGVDPLYRAHREKTILISLKCNNQHPTCFCSLFGISPVDPEGADVAVEDLGDRLAFESRTARGQDLLESLTFLDDDPRKGTAGTVDSETTMGTITGMITPEDGLEIGPLVKEEVVENLRLAFDDPMWDKLSRKCLACGMCTYLCPTCHCFDLRTGVLDESGIRFRCWDSCMFSDFTRMAGGHNPRPTKRERLRQRFLHKLQYFVERYGEFACVGCGRCLRACPVGVDIRQVLVRINEKEEAAV